MDERTLHTNFWLGRSKLWQLILLIGSTLPFPFLYISQHDLHTFPNIRMPTLGFKAPLASDRHQKIN